MSATSNAIGSLLVAWTRPEPARSRLVCIPQAGAGAGTFRGWAPLLGAGVELVAVRLPGRESRMLEPPLHTMAEVVEHLARAYVELPTAPTVLLGHCSGALVAFELARALRTAGPRAPVGLMACAQASPGLHNAGERWHALPDVELRGLLTRLDPDADVVEGELFELAAPAIRADFEVAETYSPSADAPLTIPIKVVLGSQDEWLGPDEAAAWRPHTTGSFDVEIVPGPHLLQESWSELAAVAERFLAQATRRGG